METRPRPKRTEAVAETPDDGKGWRPAACWPRPSRRRTSSPTSPGWPRRPTRTWSIPGASRSGLNSPFWVANNQTGTATVYDGNGQPAPAASPLVVTIPAPGGGTARRPRPARSPTRPRASSSRSRAAEIKSGASNFIFATEDGTIVGWSGARRPDQGHHRGGQLGLGRGLQGARPGLQRHRAAYLYATNFHAGTVDVFDQNFQPVHIPGAFTDSGIPAGYAPFGIQAINGHLYVTYAQQDADKEDDVAGAGHGFIDVFDTEGHLLQRFASQGQLNSPWGMAWAPISGYGDFSNALLVGNFGDGTINAFDFDTGDFLGKLSDSSGKPITNPGIWALSFGDGAASTSPNTLYFTAGLADEQHGLFASLTLDPSTTPTAAGPETARPDLTVTTVVTGLDQPTNLAFLGPGDFLVLEKATGKVQHVVNGSSRPRSRSSHRRGRRSRTCRSTTPPSAGCSGIALDPDFATNHGVYLYWTESSTGAVSGVLPEVGNPNSPFPPGTTQPLGNRVDRFVWNPQAQTLTFDKNLIELHAFQQDPGAAVAGQPQQRRDPVRPRRQALHHDRRQRPPRPVAEPAGGATGTGQPDDQFGGPAPDDNHLTGVILRLNPDGSTPSDNPFAGVTTQQVAQLEQQFGVTLTDAQLRTSRPTSTRSSPTAAATASGSPSTRSRAPSGSRRTATTPSTS